MGGAGGERYASVTKLSLVCVVNKSRSIRRNVLFGHAPAALTLHVTRVMTEVKLIKDHPEVAMTSQCPAPAQVSPAGGWGVQTTLCVALGRVFLCLSPCFLTCKMGVTDSLLTKVFWLLT